jgi:hypothetical protein
MSSGQAYQGCTQRTFKHALIGMLEKNYGLLHSRRVLELLAADTQALVEQFYPQPERLAAGWLVFTGTLATDSKVPPGFGAGDHELVTIAWPLLTPEDIETRANLPTGKAGRRAKRELYKRRLLRLVEHGLKHPKGPVLLTLADLGLMSGLSTVKVSKYLSELREETGKPLPTKGYHFDQGMRPTHKCEVIALYEAGLDETDIARRTGHSQSSVGRYIRDYERVKLLLAHETVPEQIPMLTGMQPNVVKAYVKLVAEYHPELVADGED